MYQKLRRLASTGGWCHTEQQLRSRGHVERNPSATDCFLERQNQVYNSLKSLTTTLTLCQYLFKNQIDTCNLFYFMCNLLPLSGYKDLNFLIYISMLKEFKIRQLICVIRR
jgi:hypothetical protein